MEKIAQIDLLSDHNNDVITEKSCVYVQN